MAEDEVDEVGHEYDEIQGGQASHKPFRKQPAKPTCNIRIEELAKPKKWLMLGTWRDFHKIFDYDRMQRFKERVQEEFSMTPEETELYFAQLRKHIRKMRSKKAMQKQMRREKMLAKKESYTLFKTKLRRALKYAFENQPPAIVSPMLRELSDNILEKLAELHHVDIPKRDSTDKNSVFLVCLADWAAKLMSHIYYEVEVFERADTDRVKHDASKITIPEQDEQEGEEGYITDGEEGEVTEEEEIEESTSRPEGETGTTGDIDGAKISEAEEDDFPPNEYE